MKKRTYKMRYSIILEGNVLARRSMRIKAYTIEQALDRGAQWLCITGMRFNARITSLKAA